MKHERSLREIVDELISSPFGQGETFNCFALYVHLLRQYTGLEFNPDVSGWRDVFGQFVRLQLLGSEVCPLDALYVPPGCGSAHVFAVESTRWCVSHSLRRGVHRVETWEALNVPEVRLYRPKALLKSSGSTTYLKTPQGPVDTSIRGTGGSG